MTVENLNQEALRLDPQQRAELASALLDSLEADTESLWLDQAQRRYDAYKQGCLQASDADDVMARMRARVDR